MAFVLLKQFRFWQDFLSYFQIEFQEEDEVPDDETLNQMIARNEDEFELFMVRKYHFLLRSNWNLDYRVQLKK